MILSEPYLSKQLCSCVQNPLPFPHLYIVQTFLLLQKINPIFFSLWCISKNRNIHHNTYTKIWSPYMKEINNTYLSTCKSIMVYAAASSNPHNL